MRTLIILKVFLVILHLRLSSSFHNRSLVDEIDTHSKYGLREKGARQGQEIVFIHIPKTAGMTFRFTINKLGQFNAQHTEKCYVHLIEHFHKRRPHEDAFTISFFRSPRSHVLSQFLECKYDNWGKRVTEGTSFPNKAKDKHDFAKWIDHFYNSWNGEDDHKLRNIDLECYHCYHPYNMQCRAMSNDCFSLHYLETSQSIRGMQTEAKNNMYKLTVVGTRWFISFLFISLLPFYHLYIPLTNDATSGTNPN